MSPEHKRVIVRLAGAEVPSVVEFDHVRVDFTGNFIRLYRGGTIVDRRDVAVFGSGQLISLVVSS